MNHIYSSLLRTSVLYYYYYSLGEILIWALRVLWGAEHRKLHYFLLLDKLEYTILKAGVFDSRSRHRD